MTLELLALCSLLLFSLKVSAITTIILGGCNHNWKFPGVRNKQTNKTNKKLGHLPYREQHFGIASKWAKMPTPQIHFLIKTEWLLCKANAHESSLFKEKSCVKIYLHFYFTQIYGTMLNHFGWKWMRLFGCLQNLDNNNQNLCSIAQLK